jgi:hypothetical protein
LSAGEVHIEFKSGAVVVLKGPAIFDVESENSGYLMLGQLTATATTATSKGFTIQARSSRVVDLGTEFSANASSDGHSRIAVTSGEVEIHLASVKTPHLLREGDVMEVEPGPTQITARIESGDDTAAFHFPTIEPPSALDYADRAKGRATFRCISGRLDRQSGPLEVLLNGAGQSNHDAPEESVFFANDQSGRLLLDLGQKVAITKVNSYSWHRSRGNEVDRVRATQKFMLYGFEGDVVPAVDGSLTEAGWVLLARVNTDE